MIENVNVGEKEIGIEREGRRQGQGLLPPEMKRIMVMMGSEKGSRKVGNGRGETGTVAGGGITQGAEVGVGIEGIVRAGIPEETCTQQHQSQKTGAEDNGTRDRRKMMMGQTTQKLRLLKLNRLWASLRLKPLK